MYLEALPPFAMYLDAFPPFAMYLDALPPFAIYFDALPPLAIYLDALLYLGCIAPHWRDEFYGTWYAQIFMHYVRSNGPAAGVYFDKGKSQVNEPEILNALRNESKAGEKTLTNRYLNGMLLSNNDFSSIDWDFNKNDDDDDDNDDNDDNNDGYDTADDDNTTDATTQYEANATDAETQAVAGSSEATTQYEANATDAETQYEANATDAETQAGAVSIEAGTQAVAGSSEAGTQAVAGSSEAGTQTSDQGISIPVKAFLDEIKTLENRIQKMQTNAEKDRSISQFEWRRVQEYAAKLDRQQQLAQMDQAYSQQDYAKLQKYATERARLEAILESLQPLVEEKRVSDRLSKKKRKKDNWGIVVEIKYQFNINEYKRRRRDTAPQTRQPLSIHAAAACHQIQSFARLKTRLSASTWRLVGDGVRL